MSTTHASTVTIACCQMALRVGDVDGNRATITQAIRRSAGSGARIIVLPELANSGYSFTDLGQARRLAEPVPGPTIRLWERLARELDVVIVGGVCEDGGSVLFNTAVVVGPDGVLATYRKAHLWDRERLIFEPGSARPPVVDIGGSRLAVMICYDLEFPEWVRLPALAGTDLLVAPVNWPDLPRPDGERPAEIVRVQAAAAQNRMFIAACDRAGPEGATDWVGGSVIVDPDGWPLAGGAAYPDARILQAECDLSQARTKTISPHNDVHADRRPELYAGIISKEDTQ